MRPASGDPALFDLILPMHATLDEEGVIRHVGPGLARLAGGRNLLNCPIFKCMTVTRPAEIEDVQTLLAASGARLKLQFVEGRSVRLRGLVAPFADGSGSILSLSLGLSELADLGGAALTNGDFSPTDLTVDMLYLIEANAAAKAESRRLIDRLDGAKSVAERQAFTDQLTGLSNRRALDRVLERLSLGRECFALMHLDLDYFKSVNDSQGHAAGDQVLRIVADKLREVTRATDAVARVGGDEFVVVFRDLDDPAIISKIASRMIEEIEQPIVFENRVCRVSASSGTAISSRYNRPDLTVMMAHADAALYASKNAGRAMHTIFDPTGTGDERAA